MDIPLVNAKCPIAVKHNITDSAILADKAKLYSLLVSFITKIAITKLDKSTPNGFILTSFNSFTKLINDFRVGNEPKLSNSFPYPA